MTSGDNNSSVADGASPEGSPEQADIRTFGRYVIEKKLGEGGMGAVYRAVDSTLKRTVALKILPREKAKNDTLVKRFQAEAQAAARLRHENIVGVYDSGEVDGFLYIAMECIDGIDVQDLVLRKGVLSIKRSLDIVKQMARALEHAYQQTIVHRDIKPANLLIDRDGNVKLADMGLARSIAETEEAGITRAGTTVGTVDYMSPEQARDSKSADCRSDMYSLGATWYYMLIGKPPFPDGDLLNKITAHATLTPPDPRDIRPNIPASVVQIIHRMLEKKPARRYQTPTELLHDLENGFSESTTSGSVSSDESDKVVSYDILAGLAEEDTEADAEISIPTRKSTSRQQRETSNDPYKDPRLPETATLENNTVKSSGQAAVVARPKKNKRDSPTRKTGKTTGRDANRKSSPASPTATASSADTMADDAATTTAIPSVREVMLARNVRLRHSAENRKQMLVLGAGFLGVMVIGFVIFSAVFGPSESDTTQPTPADPAFSPATDSGSTGGSTGDRERPTRKNPSAPARRPPRRAD